MKPDDARDALREAITARQRADAEVETSQIALNRAETFLENVEAELKGFEASDDVSNIDQIEGMKAALRAGREVVIPEMDTARAGERVRLEERRKKAVRARDDFSDELRWAKGRAAVAEKHVHRAAVEVLKSEASAVANALKVAQDRLWNLNALLAGATSLWATMPGERPGLVALPAEAVMTLNRTQPQYTRQSDPAILAGTQWRAFLADLVQNADACSPLRRGEN